jgi:hypothetical protein
MAASRPAARITWGLAASLLAHAAVFALLADRVRPPSVSSRPAAAPRPALVWLRSTPAAAATWADVERVVPARWATAAKAVQVRPITPAVSAADLIGSLPAVAAAASAPVQGVAFAPVRIALGGGPSRWVKPPADPASAVPLPPEAQQLAQATLAARQRQALADLRREAEAAAAECQAGCAAAANTASSSAIQ